MLRITADDVIALARSLNGQTLETLHRPRAFTVEIDGDHIVFTPSKSNYPRRHDKNTLQRICDTFSETNSYHPSDYNEISRNASYTLTLIKKWASNQV
jgi:hypothetical protein